MNKKFLPHISKLEHYQFVTFRTYDSLDSFLLKIRKSKLNSSKKEYIIDNYIDKSNKGCYLNGEVLRYLRAYLIKETNLYDLVSFAIMPNHIHILFKQKEELYKIINTIKGATAYTINRLLKKEGKFWEKGYYDKLIRDEKHFEIVYNYIKNNPLKANLKDYKKRFYSIYESE